MSTPYVRYPRSHRARSTLARPIRWMRARATPATPTPSSVRHVRHPDMRPGDDQCLCHSSAYRGICLAGLLSVCPFSRCDGVTLLTSATIHKTFRYIPKHKVWQCTADSLPRKCGVQQIQVPSAVYRISVQTHVLPYGKNPLGRSEFQLPVRGRAGETQSLLTP